MRIVGIGLLAAFLVRVRGDQPDGRIVHSFLPLMIVLLNGLFLRSATDLLSLHHSLASLNESSEMGRNCADLTRFGCWKAMSYDSSVVDLKSPAAPRVTSTWRPGSPFAGGTGARCSSSVL